MFYKLDPRYPVLLHDHFHLGAHRKHAITASIRASTTFSTACRTTFLAFGVRNKIHRRPEVGVFIVVGGFRSRHPWAPQLCDGVQRASRSLRQHSRECTRLVTMSACDGTWHRIPNEPLAPVRAGGSSGYYWMKKDCRARERRTIMNCRGRRAVCTFGPLADALEAISDADRLFVGCIARICSPREAPKYHLAPQAQRGRGPAIVVSPTPRPGQIRCGS